MSPSSAALCVDIAPIANAAGCNWVSLGSPLGSGHPRHPLSRPWSRASSAVRHGQLPGWVESLTARACRFVRSIA